MQSRETGPIPGINETHKELEETLRAGIEALETNLKTQTSDFTRKQLQASVQSVRERNEEAKQKLEETCNQARTIKEDWLRERTIQHAENIYRIIVEMNIKLLQQFQVVAERLQDMDRITVETRTKILQSAEK